MTANFAEEADSVLKTLPLGQPEFLRFKFIAIRLLIAFGILMGSNFSAASLAHYGRVFCRGIIGAEEDSIIVPEHRAVCFRKD